MYSSKSSPLVSIITPTYNHEQYIAECIESVLAQTFENWEMLIVNDGSTDSTLETVKQYAIEDDRIRIINQENLGIWHLAETYNIALAQARGGIIAILEGDDFWPENKLAVQTTWHHEHPEIVMSYGHYVTVAPEFTTSGGTPDKMGVVTGLEWFGMQAMRRSGIMAVSVMLDKRALNKIGGFLQWPHYPAVDNPTYFALAKLDNARFYIGSTVTGFWRHYSNQTTQSKGCILAEVNKVKSLEYIRSLSRTEQQSIGVTEQAFMERLLPHISDVYFKSVRNSLLKRDKVTAAELIPYLWHYGDTKKKVLALYGWIAMYCGWSMEPLFHTYEQFFMHPKRRSR